MYREFARFGPEKIAANADDISYIQKIKKCKTVFIDGVLPDINLQLLAFLQQMQKAGAFTHAPQTLNASRDADVYPRRELLRGLLTVLEKDLRNGVSELEGVAIRLKTELFDLREASVALAQNFIF